MKKSKLHHIGTIEIKTERLFLRRFKTKDYLGAYNNYLSAMQNATLTAAA